MASSAIPKAGIPTTRLSVPKPGITTAFSQGITKIKIQRKKKAALRNTPSLRDCTLEALRALPPITD
jgi:hypothetical protein